MNANDFSFDKGTKPEVEQVIRALYANKHRARLFYGDPITGLDYCEEYDIMGTVGKSTGEQPCPLLINNRRSLGGGAISTRLIVKIVDLQTKCCIYVHPTYDQPEFEYGKSDNPDYEVAAYKDGEIYARFHSQESADKYCDFMRGVRHSK